MHPGCGERSNFEFDTLKERSEYEKKFLPWACTRHIKPVEVLSADSQARQMVLVASKVRSGYYERNLADYRAAVARGSDWAREPKEFLDGLFWIPEGGTTGSGFTHGPGYKAFADDFPEGTRLIVTAWIELPAALKER